MLSTSNLLSVIVPLTSKLYKELTQILIEVISLNKSAASRCLFNDRVRNDSV